MTKTSSIEQLESTRLSLQARLDAEKTAIERNKLGQFATPTALARDMLAFGRQLVGMRKKLAFLDPAIGTGSFFSALQVVAPRSRIGRCVGFDIDPHYAEPAVSLWKHTALDLRIEDFTTSPPPTRTRERANLLICNPPYVRHHHMTPARKRALQQLVTDRLGLRPSGLSGLYCYFLWLADAWLKPGGIAGWLIPSEWMDVNYGVQVKAYLTEHVQLLRIHRFDSSDVQFDDALVSSTVVWCKKQASVGANDVELSFGGTLSEPSRLRTVTGATLTETRKWSQLFKAEPPPKVNRIHGDGATLADIFTIKRGIATGSNQFFVLSASEISSRGMSMDDFRPILPSPRYLAADEIRALDDGSPDIAKKQYLLSVPELSEAAVQHRHPTLWRYLQEGKQRGIHERYLCRHRRPWFSQEHRPAAPLLCTYMGRITDDSPRPFRFILNHSRATAANVYLLFYPRPTFARHLTQHKHLLRSIWAGLGAMPVDVLLGEGRVYGGGLHKLEPSELARVPLSSLNVDVPRGVE